jgi:hypothetical protein
MQNFQILINKIFRQFWKELELQNDGILDEYIFRLDNLFPYFQILLTIDHKFRTPKI